MVIWPGLRLIRSIQPAVPKECLGGVSAESALYKPMPPQMLACGLYRSGAGPGPKVPPDCCPCNTATQMRTGRALNNSLRNMSFLRTESVRPSHVAPNRYSPEIGWQSYLFCLH